MRKRIAKHLPVIYRCGLIAVATVTTVMACIAAGWFRDYTMGLIYLGTAVALLGWAYALRTAEIIAEDRNDWKQSAADWQAIAEDRRR